MLESSKEIKNDLYKSILNIINTQNFSDFNKIKEYDKIKNILNFMQVNCEQSKFFHILHYLYLTNKYNFYKYIDENNINSNYIFDTYLYFEDIKIIKKISESIYNDFISNNKRDYHIIEYINKEFKQILYKQLYELYKENDLIIKNDILLLDNITSLHQVLTYIKNIKNYNINIKNNIIIDYDKLIKKNADKKIDIYLYSEKYNKDIYDLIFYYSILISIYERKYEDNKLYTYIKIDNKIFKSLVIDNKLYSFNDIKNNIIEVKESPDYYSKYKKITIGLNFNHEYILGQENKNILLEYSIIGFDKIIIDNLINLKTPTYKSIIDYYKMI